MRTTVAAILLVAATLVSGPRSAFAGDPPVKITLTDGRVVEGALGDVSGGVYHLKTASGELLVDENDIREIDFLREASPETKASAPGSLPISRIPPISPRLSISLGSTPDRVSLDVKGGDLAEIASELCTTLAANVLVGPDIEAKVTSAARDLPWSEVVASMASQVDCTVDHLGRILLLERTEKVSLKLKAQSGAAALVLLTNATRGKSIVVSPELAKRQVTVDVPQASWRRAIDAVLWQIEGDPFQVVELSPDLVAIVPVAASGGDTTAPDPADPRTVSVDVNDADLAEVAGTIGRSAGVNVVVDDSVSARVSLRLRDVPWKDAALALARLASCDLEQRGDVFVLTREGRVSFELGDPGASALVPARTVLERIADQAGRRIEVPKELDHVELCLRFRDVPFLAALGAIARWSLPEVYEVRDDGETITFVRNSPPAVEESARDHWTSVCREHQEFLDGHAANSPEESQLEGDDLFPWQVRPDMVRPYQGPPLTEAIRLENGKLTLTNPSDRPLYLASGRSDWSVFSVKFQVRVAKGTRVWFLGKVYKLEDWAPDEPWGWDRIPLCNANEFAGHEPFFFEGIPQGEWVSIEYRCFGTVYDCIVGGNIYKLRFKENHGGSCGGFGFMVDGKGSVEIKDVRSHVFCYRDEQGK